MHGGGREALVRSDLTPQPPPELRRIALHGDVDVRSITAEQQVPHRAPDQVDRGLGRGLAHAVEAAERGKALGEAVGLDVQALGRHRRHFSGAFRAVPYHDELRGWVAFSTSGARGASGSALRRWASPCWWSPAGLWGPTLP